MSKDELIELLKDYKENKARQNLRLKELKMCRLQLKGYEEIETSITQSFGHNSDIHSKNNISDKVSDAVVKNETRKKEIQEQISKLEEIVRDLTDKVNAVEDRLIGLKYKERELLVAYYIDGRTAEDIGNQLYFQLFNQTRSARHVQRVIERATEKMINL